MSPVKLPTEWNLNDLYSSDDDPKMAADRKVVTEESYRFINKWKNRDDYLHDPAVLKQALDEYDRWMTKYAYGADEMYYFDLRTSQDENSPRLKAKYAKIEEYTIKIVNDIQFFTLNIAKIPAERQGKFINYRPLGPYRHFLTRLFDEARHILTEKEEKILNLKSVTSYANWTKLTSGFLAKAGQKVLGEDGKTSRQIFTSIIGLLESRSKDIRDSAGRALNKILADHVEVAEAELNSVLMNKKIDDELRGFDRPDSSRHLNDDISTKVVDVVIKEVAANFDISRRFYRLKAGLLGLKKLRYHERNIPIGDIEKIYTYKDSVELVSKVLGRLDPEFGSIFNGFATQGYIDVYPAAGKRSGAFCTHYLISQPTYILLNHTNKLTDVLTLAHETGHAINNELIRRNQNALNFGTPTSTAEVASTFMEDFVFEELLADADAETKLAIMMKKLNDDVSSIFRQVAAYLFEKDLHTAFREKGFLSKEEIGRIFVKHMADYMGAAVEQSRGSENWWVYWNHIRYFFYVYSYASGLLISKSLQNQVRAQPEFIKEVEYFLSAGRSQSPQEIFNKVNIDITRPDFWKAGIGEVRKLLIETEDLAKSLKKI